MKINMNRSAIFTGLAIYFIGAFFYYNFIGGDNFDNIIIIGGVTTVLATSIFEKIQKKKAR